MTVMFKWILPTVCRGLCFKDIEGCNVVTTDKNKWRIKHTVGIYAILEIILTIIFT